MLRHKMTWFEGEIANGLVLSEVGGGKNECG